MLTPLYVLNIESKMSGKFVTSEKNTHGPE